MRLRHVGDAGSVLVDSTRKLAGVLLVDPMLVMCVLFLLLSDDIYHPTHLVAGVL